MKGGELGQPDLPEAGEGIAADEGLVAAVGGGPDPAPHVGEPLLQVVTERQVLVLAQDRRLDHLTATVALVPRAEQPVKEAPLSGSFQIRSGVADNVLGGEGAARSA